MSTKTISPIKTALLAGALALAPASAFSCEWMKQQTASTPATVEIGSAAKPAATPVDEATLSQGPAALTTLEEAAAAERVDEPAK